MRVLSGFSSAAPEAAQSLLSLLPGNGEQVRVGKLHQQGAREGQQDCFGVSDESLVPTHGLLAVVADGMGGLSGGERISQLVVQAVLDAFSPA